MFSGYVSLPQDQVDDLDHPGRLRALLREAEHAAGTMVSQDSFKCVWFCDGEHVVVLSFGHFLK